MKIAGKNILIRLIGVPFLTFLLYVFDCSDPRYYIYQLLSFFVLSIVLWEGNKWITIFLNKYIKWEENVLLLWYDRNGYVLRECTGVFTTKENAQEIYDRTGHKRHYIKPDELINLSDSTIAVCNQWGKGNIENFVDHVNHLEGNYSIENK